MDAKTRRDIRLACRSCRYEIIQVNGRAPEPSQQYEGDVENISKGGFRFVTSMRYELEDRIRARIIFSDGSTQESFGRICYCNEGENDGDFAYGFSVIDGFIH